MGAIKGKLIPLLLLTLLQNPISGQVIQHENYGVNGGVVLALGNKFDRIGLNFNFYYNRSHLQFNSQLGVYINVKNLGPQKTYPEGVLSLGLLYGYGKVNQTDTNLFFGSTNNQTQRSNSIAYAFNYYFNSIRTSQQTGTISIEVNRLSLIAENDLFAKGHLDRFRTGAILLQYRKNEMQFGINSTLFTGEMGPKIVDENYPYNHLYKCREGGTYAHASHGLLSAQFQYLAFDYQTVRLNAGIDSERIRHAIQNRFIHDLILLPKGWRRENSAHLPMLDANGKQYLFREDQKVKPTELYYNLFLNPNTFY